MPCHRSGSARRPSRETSDRDGGQGDQQDGASPPKWFAITQNPTNRGTAARHGEGQAGQPAKSAAAALGVRAGQVAGRGRPGAADESDQCENDQRRQGQRECDGRRPAK